MPVALLSHNNLNSFYLALMGVTLTDTSAAVTAPSTGQRPFVIGLGHEGSPDFMLAFATFRTSPRVHGSSDDIHPSKSTDESFPGWTLELAIS